MIDLYFADDKHTTNQQDLSDRCADVAVFRPLPLRKGSKKKVPDEAMVDTEIWGSSKLGPKK